jgi:hypothetical protein
VYKLLTVKSSCYKSSSHRWKDGIKLDFRYVVSEYVNYIQFAQKDNLYDEAIDRKREFLNQVGIS